MALQSPQHHNPDTGPTRLAADLHIPDGVLDATSRAEAVLPRQPQRHRDARRPVSMPLGMGRVRQGIDRVLDAIAVPATTRDGSDR